MSNKFLQIFKSIKFKTNMMSTIVKYIFVVFLLIILSVNSNAQTSIIQEDFSINYSQWTIYQADQTVSVSPSLVSGQLNLAITNPSGINWYAGFQKQGIALTSGDYKLTFEAKGNAAKELVVFLAKNYGDWASIVTKNVVVSTSLVAYTFTFNLSADDANTRLFFGTGNFSQFVIDNIKLEKTGSNPLQNYALVWSDEFNTPGLPDSTKWGYEKGRVRNQELQYFTQKRLENARIEDTVLIIQARKELYNGSDYTSASLISKGVGDWKYGKVEMNVKVPEGKGTWPALWMLPTYSEYGGWPKSGEIDILEYIGSIPNDLHFTTHFEGDKVTGHESAHKAVNAITQPYNKFIKLGIIWTPTKIEWYANGVKYHEYVKKADNYNVWPFDKDFYLILNMAYGGSWGGFDGLDDSKLPQKLLIDYVRVYQLNESSGPYQISFTPSIGGSVKVTPQRASYPEGTQVTIEAIPDAGYTFKVWKHQSRAKVHTFNITKDMNFTPTFSDGTETYIDEVFETLNHAWELYNANTPVSTITSSVQNGQLEINVNNPPGDNWYTGIQKFGIGLTKGCYKLSFDAYAGQSADMLVMLAKNYGDFGSVVSANQLIGTTKQRYTIDFYLPEDDQELRLFFGLGGFSGKIYLDNIKLISKSATISTTTTTTFCQGGSVVLTASAGGSYNWMNGTTQVGTAATYNATAAGSFTVEVTNAAGCKAISAATTVTVNSNPIATISTTTSTTFCQGGSVLLTASAGSSYIWKNGTTQVGTTSTYSAASNGSYTVEVTNTAGCKAISAPKNISVVSSSVWYRDQDGDGKGDLSQTLSSCTQPTGYVSVAGDACPEDPAKIAPGLCGCGIVETACSNIPPVVTFTNPLNNQVLKAPSTLVVGVKASDADGINNVQLFINGTLVREEKLAPYDWNNTGQDILLQNLTSGIYQLKAIATDSKGLKGESTIRITVEAPVVNTDKIIGADCAAANANVVYELNASYRTNATNYSWWFSGSQATITPFSGMPYKVNVTLANYYSGGSVCVGVNLNIAPYYVSYCKAVGVCGARLGVDNLMLSEELSNEEASIFPNPTNADFIFIESNRSIEKIEIKDAMGTVIKEINTISSEYPIAIDGLAIGTYIVKISTENNIVTKKLIIVR